MADAAKLERVADYLIRDSKVGYRGRGSAQPDPIKYRPHNGSGEGAEEFDAVATSAYSSNGFAVNGGYGRSNGKLNGIHGPALALLPQPVGQAAHMAGTARLNRVGDDAGLVFRCMAMGTDTLARIRDVNAKRPWFCGREAIWWGLAALVVIPVVVGLVR